VERWRKAPFLPQVDNGDLIFHTNAVRSLAFSPSGRYLASGSVAQGRSDHFKISFFLARMKNI